MNVAVRCESCSSWITADDASLPPSQCPTCAQPRSWTGPNVPEGPLKACRACGHDELYRAKDFPVGWGLGVLAVSCLAFLVLQLLYRPWLAWAVLLTSAALDAVLYHGFVKDLFVCYRCGCEHRRIPSAARPFDLATAEKTRQAHARSRAFPRLPSP